MISPEVLRRYPFFSGMNYDQIVELAKTAKEESAAAGTYFFHDGDPVEKFYLLIEGAVAIVLEIPDRKAKQPVAGQLTGEITMKDVTVSTVGTGSVFGWPGLIPPHEANAGAKAVTECKVYSFDCKTLLAKYEQDPQFAYVLTLRAAQVMRERLRDMRIESLAFAE